MLRLAVVASAALMLLGSSPVRAAAEFSVKAPSAVLVESSSGQTIYAKAADAERPPASMTKLMTLHLALRAVAEHKVRLADPVSVSENAYRLGGSQIWLEPGETIAFGQLLRAIAVGSANDACVAVAEHLYGTEAAFVAEMNKEARRLGMAHTHYANAHGLDAPGHYTSAADMARLARVAVQDPGLLALTAQRSDRTLRDGKGGHLWLVNPNRLLGRFPGIDGLKTGYTRAAGYCLAASAQRGGLRLIAVVMGAPSSKERFEDAATLLQHGFMNYEGILLARRGDALGSVKVLHGRSAAVQLLVQRDVRAVRRRGESLKIAVRPVLPQSVAAPVRRGQRLGRAEVLAGGRRIATVPLVAARDVGRATFLWIVRDLAARVLHL